MTQWKDLPRITIREEAGRFVVYDPKGRVEGKTNLRDAVKAAKRRFPGSEIDIPQA